MKRFLPAFWLCLFVALAAQAQTPGFRVLVFSATAGYRHASITNGIAAIQKLGDNNNFAVDATEDATLFTDSNLAQYKAIIFLNTTGDVLTNAQQQAALQHFVEAGGGWVGIHSAADTEHNWPWYGGLVGAYYTNHPAVQQATVKVADRIDPSTSMLPQRWVRTDEWYNFDHNPRGVVHVLATVDESTYTGGSNGYDHSIAWDQNYDGGRAWYTAGGHTPESYSEPLFQAHLLGGIQFAAGVKPADPGSTVDSNYQKVVLDKATYDPIELTIAPDGRVFYIERGGNIKIYNPTTFSITLAGYIPVEEQIEDGLLGITLDTGFSTNNWIYLFYSPSGTVSEQHISRFTMTGNTVDMTSEKILLRIPTQRVACCHSAGSLFMHTNGDLYISAGDNTDPFSSNGFAPLDERPGRSNQDSQKSASNENDLRGKILRIHPQPDGTYTIPPGNLFPPGTPLTKPEIYIMGCRNPFRMFVDPATGWLYWGEVGPDAIFPDPTRGPKGYDEINQARAAGNFGWPYFAGNNQAYVAYDFATGLSGAPFNPLAPVNTSPNNTGPTNLPPAQPAWIWYEYANSNNFPELYVWPERGRCVMCGPVYHYSTNVLTKTKVPPYFDNTLFIWEWAREWIMELKIDDSGNLLKINQFIPTILFKKPIDMKIGPDGVIYAIEWGSGYSGNSDSQVVRIDYVGGNHSPVAVATATPDNGSLPLVVQFSSAGTYDPDPNDNISIAWSFYGNGVINSTAPNPVFTYTNAGNYEAQLIVTDSHGAKTVANVPISAGNNKPVVTILQPPNGAVFDWGKALAYQIAVSDVEDGSTAAGTIDCSNVLAAPMLGHNDHSHGEGIFAGCSGVFTAPINTDSDSDNLYLILNATYTDKGAPNVAPLLGKSTYIFPPRHKQAEFCTTNGTVTAIPTSDPAGGGLDIAGINHGSYISLSPLNLTNINGISYRVATIGTGGRIEARVDSVAGPLIGTASVPFTAGVYTNVTATITDPGGTHTIYFVFLGNPGDSNLFVLNWLEFEGSGLSLSSAPFGGIARSLPGIVQAEDFDNGGEGVAFHDADAYRGAAVDVEPTADVGGGYDLTSTLAGEWLNYSVNAAAAGLYTFSARVASAEGGGVFHLEFNGANKTGPIVMPNTGGLQTWQTLSVSNVPLDAGPQVMRLVMDNNGASGFVGNFNYFQAALTLSNNPPTIFLTAPLNLSSFLAPANITVSANASDIDVNGFVSRVDFFGSGSSLGSLSTAPYSVNWTNVPAGNYLLTARATDNIGNATTSAPVTIRVVSGPPPSLGFTPSGNNVLLSWPMTAGGYLLETTTNLGPGTVWSVVPYAPALQNGQQVFSIPISNSSQFFRLKQ